MGAGADEPRRRQHHATHSARRRETFCCTYSMHTEGDPQVRTRASMHVRRRDVDIRFFGTSSTPKIDPDDACVTHRRDDDGRRCSSISHVLMPAAAAACVGASTNLVVSMCRAGVGGDRFQCRPANASAGATRSAASSPSPLLHQYRPSTCFGGLAARSGDPSEHELASLARNMLRSALAPLSRRHTTPSDCTHANAPPTIQAAEYRRGGLAQSVRGPASAYR